MRITIFGSTGSVGRRLVDEALRRDHEVTAVVRRAARLADLPAGVNGQVGDGANADDVDRLSAGRDVALSATRPPNGREPELVPMTEALLAGVARSGARLLAVGGAATLTVPGGGGATVLDDPRYLAEPYRPIGRACATQLDVYRAAPAGTDWAYLSPPALLLPGERTGAYRLGGDELVVDTDGTSTISVEDLAVALLDEAERPKHHRTRFTVGY